MRPAQFILASLFLAAHCMLASCSDDDLNAKQVPDAVMQTFSARFANTEATWEKEDKQYKAEFWLNGRETEAWFRPDGTWVRTETDVLITELPAAVTTYVTENYPDYVIDDADRVETPDNTYYEIELEKKDRDVQLRLTPDGQKL